MVYFIITRMGFNCGYDKNKCDRYPDGCMECVKQQMRQMGFDVEMNTKVIDMDSDEKRLQMFRDRIWQKFLDVLNIKHLIFLERNSGVPVIDFPVSGTGIDVSLLTGFIQANITFSETENLSEEEIVIKSPFYEFQYKNFNILLKEGAFIRLCIILDNKASQSLRKRVTDFLQKYELTFLKQLVQFQKQGKNELEHSIDFVIEEFNIKFVFPMTLTHTIPPQVEAEIEQKKIQAAIMNLAKEMLSTRKFFFIFNLLNRVQSIVNIEAQVILYELYLLLEKEIIMPTTVESAEDELKSFEESRARRVANNELISSLISTKEEDPLADLKEQAVSLDENTAKSLMEKFIKKGKKAEKSLIYKEAQVEYERALYLATGFGFDKEIGKISFIILELDKKIRAMEFDYAIDKAESAEKRKDYIEAIKNYQKAKELALSDPDADEEDSKIKKLRKKIEKLQKNM